jgi:hypothetical protein
VIPPSSSVNVKSNMRLNHPGEAVRVSKLAGRIKEMVPYPRYTRHMNLPITQHNSQPRRASTTYYTVPQLSLAPWDETMRMLGVVVCMLPSQDTGFGSGAGRKVSGIGVLGVPKPAVLCAFLVSMPPIAH